MKLEIYNSPTLGPTIRVKYDGDDIGIRYILRNDGLVDRLTDRQPHVSGWHDGNIYVTLPEADSRASGGFTATSPSRL